MKILVTGAGSGFIGGAVVQELTAVGNEVTIYGLHPPDYETDADYVFGDILDGERLAKLGDFDGTIHFAGIVGTSVTFAQIEKTASVNILGTLKLLERQRGKGFFIQPNLIGDWLNPYMISKRAAERFGLMYGAEFGTKYISLRLTDVFGPRQNTSHGKAVPNFITNALTDEPLTIYGSGEYEMRLFYVLDLAKIVAGVVERWDSLPKILDIVSLQDASQIRVADLARKIVRLTESASEIVHVSMRRGQPKAATGYDADLEQSAWLMAQLGVTETPHERALADTIRWYSEQPRAT